jgi:hypothetical protein
MDVVRVPGCRHLNSPFFLGLSLTFAFASYYHLL